MKRESVFRQGTARNGVVLVLMCFVHLLSNYTYERSSILGVLNQRERYANRWMIERM